MSLSIDETTSAGMSGERLTAYSDGVIAIIVTIMVLDLHAPSTADAQDLFHLWRTFLAYALSFLLVSIYWVNHHHLLHSNRRIGRDVLWFNIHWLFWLSLFPFATAYLTSTQGASIAIAVYALLGTVTAVAFLLLGLSLSRRNAHVAVVKQVERSRQRKSAIAILISLSAAPLAFVSKPLAFTLFDPAGTRVFPSG